MDDCDRRSRPNDRHVMPLYGREHESSPDCWCQPTIDFTAAITTNNTLPGRVWTHREDN